MNQGKYLFFAALISYSGFSLANSDMDRLMDSYLIAKSDEGRKAASEEEIRKQPYTVQVASYINEKDAVSHVQELSAHEKEVTYAPVFVRGQVWFKVCVGHFATKDEAEKFRSDFIKRRDEPFAVVISLLEQPDRNTQIKTALKSKSEKNQDEKISHVKIKKIDHGRAPADIGNSIVDQNQPQAKKEAEKTIHAVELKKDSTHVGSVAKENSHNGGLPQIKLIPKTQVESVKAVVAHGKASGPAKEVAQVKVIDKSEAVAHGKATGPAKEVAQVKVVDKSKAVDAHGKAIGSAKEVAQEKVVEKSKAVDAHDNASGSDNAVVHEKITTAARSESHEKAAGSMKAVEHGKASESDNKIAAEGNSRLFGIQLEAFPNEASAKEKLAKLKNGDMEYYYQPAQVNGKTWYRLFMGKFKTKQEAEAFHKTYRQARPGTEAFVRRLPSSES